MSGQALVKSYVCFKKENGFEKKDLFFSRRLESGVTVQVCQV